jgi:PilZ domain-containing protein
MTPLSHSDALSLLFAAGEAELEITAGAFVRTATVLVEAERVKATAPRLSVATGMRLTGRVLGPDGRPWEVGLRIDDASYHSPDLAMITMSVTGVEVDRTRRAAARVPIGGVTWLEAVNCQDIVDGDRVDGTLEDLSRTGVAFTTRRILRVNDRLIFHGRFFADEINGEVRVAAVRPATSPGQTIVGCRFIDLDEASEHKIDRILNGGREEPRAPGVDLAALRTAVNAPPTQDDGGSWRSRFRKR